MDDQTSSSGGSLPHSSDLLEVRRIEDFLAFSTDAGDWGSFLDCFAPDATGDYGDLGSGPIGEIVEAIKGSQGNYLGTMNFVGTHHAQVLDDRVVARTYVISHHFRIEGDLHWDDHVGTRYADRFVKMAGVWKIEHREARVLWFRQDEVRGGWSTSTVL